MQQQTQAQIFAAEYAKSLAVQMLRTIKWVRRAANVIMVIAMVVSYAHQAHYLEGLGAQQYAAWSIPGALDCLTFICVKVLSTAAVVKSARVVAGAVLIFPVSVSSAVNFIAPGATVVKWMYVACVLLIPAAELVAGRIKPDFAAMDAMERAIAPAPEPELTPEMAEAADLPEAPVSPAVGGGKREPYGPRKDEYSPRQKSRMKSGR
jgi:hypothetical protein